MVLLIKSNIAKYETLFMYTNVLTRPIETVIEEMPRIIFEKPKPFVKWAGGKRRSLIDFRNLGIYPPSAFNIKSSIYFEPFLGGGAVFFDLLPARAILSDLNKELVITYNFIKNNVETLIPSLKKHALGREYFTKIRSLNPDVLDDLTIASRLIFLNRTCFNGLYRVNSKGGFNVPFGRYAKPLICDEDNLRKVSRALEGVEIKHRDYKEILNEAKKDDFIYFDPPYYPLTKTASFTSYTKEAFLDKEQIELRDAFLELNKKGCLLMLSNSDTIFIKKIYSSIKGIRINKIEAGRAINSKGNHRGRITEILITNY